EPRQPSERAVLLAPRDDALGEGRPDPRQPRDLRHVGAVEVDPFAGEERACEPGGRTRRRAQAAGGRSVAADGADVSGRGRRGRRERTTYARASEGEEGGEEGGCAILHAAR